MWRSLRRHQCRSGARLRRGWRGRQDLLHRRLRLDVDPPACQLGGESGVLSFLTDCQRKLPVGHDHRSGVVLFTNFHLEDLRRAERVANEAGRVRVPLDHVDPLTVQLVHDVLYPDSAKTDARTDRVHAFLPGCDSYLAPEPRLARDRLDLDDSAVDLGHFQLEQPP